MVEGQFHFNSVKSGSHKQIPIPIFLIAFQCVFPYVIALPRIQDGARKSALQEDDNLMSYFHDDARTLYEVFQRGLQVSGHHHISFCHIYLVSALRIRERFLESTLEYIVVFMSD